MDMLFWIHFAINFDSKLKKEKIEGIRLHKENLKTKRL